MMTNPVGGLSHKPNLLAIFETKPVSKIDCCAPRKLISEQSNAQFNGKVEDSKPSFSVLA